MPNSQELQACLNCQKEFPKAELHVIKSGGPKPDKPWTAKCMIGIHYFCDNCILKSFPIAGASYEITIEDQRHCKINKF